MVMALPRACGSPWRIWLQIGNGESLCRSGSPSPTHVGMDRLSTVSLLAKTTKPHARGDGPRANPGRAVNKDQAPRTWGWTAASRASRASLVPSPTHVGMDRLVLGVIHGSATKPHARGDGPSTRLRHCRPVCQAPRTWGWTAHRMNRERLKIPSPTHVGMDRSGPATRDCPRAKPHARGDGPLEWRHLT